MLKEDVNERTLSHRLAIYIEKQMERSELSDSYPHVDVEYNRIGKGGNQDPKRLDDDLQDLLQNIEEIIEDRHNNQPDNKIDDILQELQGRLIYPDIIVHKRGHPENLLVMEIKKGTSEELSNEDNFDHLKLANFTDPRYPKLDYTYGIFLKLRIGANSQASGEAILNSAWFEDGKEIDENPIQNSSQ